LSPMPFGKDLSPDGTIITPNVCAGQEHVEVKAQVFREANMRATGKDRV